jgi:hypothetical protein
MTPKNVGKLRKQNLRRLTRYDLLILDDWAVHPLTAEESRDLLTILDDRWHEWFADADAVFDRVIHHAYHVPILGESMRKILPTVSDSAITNKTNEYGDLKVVRIYWTEWSVITGIRGQVGRNTQGNETLWHFSERMCRKGFRV